MPPCITPVEVTLAEYTRLSCALKHSQKYAVLKIKWTVEEEKKVVKSLKDEVSVNEIIRQYRQDGRGISGRKIIQIKKKYGLWGA